VSDVLVLGDANPDLILRGDVVPRFGQVEQLLSSADVVIGGSGAIVAHGLARLGRGVRLAALVGRDAFGDLLCERLGAGGVDVSAVQRHAGVATGLTVVLADVDDRAVLTFTGAVAELTGDQAASALSAAIRDGARHLHVSSLFLLPRLAPDLADMMALARSRGLTTSLDTNFDPSGRWEGVEALLPHLDLMLPNRTEVLAIARTIHAPSAGPDVDDPVAAAALLARRGPLVVVKLGAGGAVAVHPDGRALHRAATPVLPVDTTGAGDTFDAAYLDSLLSGSRVEECLRRATLAGALSTSAVGGTAGQPTRDQLQEPPKGPA
jgi:ribokinase